MGVPAGFRYPDRPAGQRHGFTPRDLDRNDVPVRIIQSKQPCVRAFPETGTPISKAEA